jgi:DtxR family Mn-dependent transcriptional regulator
MQHNINRTTYPFDDTDLSAKMEDYLETIALLAKETRVVRVKDIAKALKVKMPSVTSALQKLGERGLIVYEKYGYVDLTEEGRQIAEKVYSRHSCLSDFFHEVLRIDRKKADEEACRVEHHLSPDSCRQFFKLVEYVKSRSDDGSWMDDLIALMEEKPLTEFPEGAETVIVRIEAQGVLKKRLMELGFRKGERLLLVRYAPFKDPLQVQIKGYNLSLRVEEANTIIVKPVRSA